MKEKTITFFILFILGFILYSNCFDILVPADNYSYFYLFDKGLAESLRQGAISASLYFTGFPFIYLLYKLFGSASSLWVGTCIVLHVANSYLVYLITRFWLNISSCTKYLPCFFSALIFLVSPYQVESVLWGAVSARWLFHAFTFLLCLYVLLLYVTNRGVKKIIFIYVFFLLALFSNETAIVFPLISGICFFMIMRFKKNSITVKEYFFRIFFFQALFILLFFIINKLYVGHWLWHGGKFEEQVVNPIAYIKTGIKYLAKFFLLYRYLPYEVWDDQARDFFSNNIFLITLFITVALFSVIVIRKLNISVNINQHFITMFFLCFLFMLIPVLPLDSSFLNYHYPDRYAYIASVFFYSFFVISIYLFFPKTYSLLLSVYVVLNIIFLIQTSAIWRDSNDYCKNLANDFAPFCKYDRVYVLNETEYYKGVPAFRSALAATIYYKYQNDQPNKIKIVSGAYQNSFNDSIIFVSIDSIRNKVIVRSTLKKTPYFCTGGWPESYETDEYVANFDSTGCSYELQFKNKIPANAVFLYINSGRWKKAAFTYNISSDN